MYKWCLRHARLENLGKRRKIIYRSYTGIKHYYTFADITRVSERLDGGYEFYSGKKKLFRIDNNLPEGSTLAIKLQVKQVPCDKAGMTIDKFTLKQGAFIKLFPQCLQAFLLDGVGNDRAE